MCSLKELLNDYQTQHNNRISVLTHSIGIPAILLGTLILLSWISVSIVARWHITFAWIAIVATLVYYYRLNAKLAAAMSLIFIILTLICTWIAFPRPNTFNIALFIILFVGGWILFFIGHAAEKSKPTFLSSLTQISIAPLFLLIEVLILLKLTHYFDLETLMPSRKD